MTLITISELTCNEGLYFRYLTMVAKQELNLDVVIEADKEKTDFYFNFLKTKGWLDFVDEFVRPEWRVDGIRVDTELSYPNTILTRSISYENVLSLAGQMKNLSRF